MLEILKRIKADVSEVKVDLSGLKADMSVLKADGSDLKARMDRVEQLVKGQIRDNAGMLVMMCATAGAFDERVAILEEDMLQMKDPESVALFPQAHMSSIIRINGWLCCGTLACAGFSVDVG